MDSQNITLETNETIEYYNLNSKAFTNSTQKASLSDIHQEFISRLQPNSSILDFGCGSGRDSAAFKSLGFQVSAIDGSKKMCEIASEFSGIPVKKMRFEEFNQIDSYDGIWACASLLHLSSKKLPEVFQSLMDGLHEKGILYCSFKYGAFEGLRNGRFFLDLNEKAFLQRISSIEQSDVLKIWLTEDARKERKNEQWLNILIQKKTESPLEVTNKAAG